jgi:hypothetical protein
LSIKDLSVVFVLLTFGFLFHIKDLNEIPQYKHCWAQSDRYAIALGFINNSGDFFHPESFVFNKQFPGDFRQVWDDTITAVDFPIHDYLVSWIMRLFNSTDPWCFRLYTLLYSLTGLYYLYKFTTLFTTSLFKSFAVLGFGIATPVFLYFQNGFLPTVPSLANCMIALFFLFRHFKFGLRKDYVIAFSFLTLAVLARLPFAILLVACICLELVLWMKMKTTDGFKWLTIVTSIGFIIGYYFYNHYLRSKYGSLFLDHIVPAPTLSDLGDYVKTTVDSWKFIYYTPVHYLVFAGAGIFFMVYWMQKRQLPYLSKMLLLLTVIFLFGCFLYYLLMAFQFLCHDYYFLDSYYLPVLCLFFIFILHSPSFKSKHLNHMLKFGAVLVFVPAFMYSAHSLKDYRKSFENEQTTAVNFDQSSAFLDSLTIPSTAKILVIAPDGPNNPFLHLRRKGYAVIFPNKEKLDEALKWPFDFVVLENSKLIPNVLHAHPDIHHSLKRLSTNGKITVFERLPSGSSEGLDEFLNLKSMSLLLNSVLRLDSVSDEFSAIQTSVNPLTGKLSGFVGPETEYALSFKVRNLSALNQKSSVIKIRSHFGSVNKLNDCIVTVSIDSKGKNLGFFVHDLNSLVKPGSWNPHDVLFALPKIREEEFELSVFIWNKGKNSLCYDHFELKIYQ